MGTFRFRALRGGQSQVRWGSFFYFPFLLHHPFGGKEGGDWVGEALHTKDVAPGKIFWEQEVSYEGRGRNGT